MPYSLLYTRNRVTDEIFHISTIAIPDSSIMIEVISFINKFKRDFGRVAPIVVDGSGSIEEGRSRPLNFVKNRIFLDDYPAPYYLRFYPRYNITKFAVSVYTGVPGPASQYKTIANLTFRYRLISGRIDVSTDSGNSSTLSIFPGSIAGYLLGGPSQRIYAQLANGQYFWVKEGNWTAATSISAARYLADRAALFVDL